MMKYNIFGNVPTKILDNSKDIEWQGIVVHCSASSNPDQRNFESIHLLHTSPKYRLFQWGEYVVRGRQWTDIGYNYVIEDEGLIKEGRPLNIPGAHTKGWNRKLIGICLTGTIPSKEQLSALKFLTDELADVFGFPYNCVYGHRDLDKTKTCPNFNVKEWLDGELRQSKAEQSRT